MLSHMGIASRKELKRVISKGRVTIDGVAARAGKEQIDVDKNIVEVDGVRVIYKEFIHIMLNKPAGYVSARSDSRDYTVIDIVADDFGQFELFPVGRLDKDTEGLIVLSNDGKLAHSLLSPKKHIPKTYYARIDGIVNEEDVKKFKDGIILEDFTALPAELKILKAGEESEIEVTIYEGKFHQVKRMFDVVGKPVIYLKRVSMGKLELDETLELGEYRELAEEELILLQTRD